MKHDYQIADIGISVETEVDYADKDPYRKFLNKDSSPQVHFRFRSGTLPEPAGTCAFQSAGLAVYESEGIQQRVLLNWSKPYAFSTLSEDGGRGEVILDPNGPELWGGYVFAAIALEHLLVRRGRVILHASYIDWNGRAILFTAPSETGKSTQAALWEQFRGSETINGDRTCLSADEGVVMAHGLPMAGTSGICKNRSLSVAAVVYLSQAPENRLEQLRGAAAFKAVFSGTWVNDWDRADTEAAVDTVSRIVTGVPVFHLACRPDQEAVDLLAAALGG